jgi:hypothetical protein
MHRLSGRQPSPAIALAFVALLAALSGTAVALPGKNTVDSGDLKKNAVKAADIARNAVTTPKLRTGAVNAQKVRNDSLTGADINESTLGQVPSANTANTATHATNAGNADTLDGRNSTDFLPANGNTPSGTLLTGVLNVSAGHGGGTPSPAGTLGTDDISFGVRFASAPQYRYVEGGATGPAECGGGTLANPDAAPGFVCVYEDTASNVTAISDNTPRREGVTLFIRSNGGGEAFIIAAWAARAP